MKNRIWIFIVILAGTAGWFISRRWAPPAGPTVSSVPGRRILYYQSAMHPWIKSDQPGNCTICGMKLTPVYEGDPGFESAQGVTTLSSNIVHVINVQTTEVRRQPLVRTLRVAGSVEDTATRHRILAAYVDGRIDELFVNFVGAEVVAGEPLATFYSPMLLAAEREYRALLSKGGSPSLRIQNEQLLSAAGQRLRQFGLSESQLAEIPIKAETNIHSALLAPMTGTVVARNVYEGQYVKEGDALFEIADFSTMWFIFDAYERDLPWLHIGQTVEISTPALPGRMFAAPITFIDPNLNPATRSARVRVELENPLVETNSLRRLFYHKLYAQGKVRAGSESVLALPRSAVLSPGGDPFVYVASGPGRYLRRQVQLGRMGDELCEILAGLEPGEMVVTSGALLIDAQTQLNQSGETPPSVAASNAPAGPSSQLIESNATEASGAAAWSTEQLAAATNVLALASEIGEALAGDNLKKFNEAITRMEQLPGSTTTQATPRSLHASIQKARALRTAADLLGARKGFLTFSTAAVALARELRRADLTTAKIFQCPMIDQAIAGAPRVGQWVQVQGPLRNPYFGAEMLECGTEVQP